MLLLNVDGRRRRQPVEKSCLVNIDREKSCLVDGWHRRLPFSRLTAGSPFHHAQFFKLLEKKQEFVPQVLK